MVTPAAKMPVALYLNAAYELSEWVACKLAGVSPTPFRYCYKTNPDGAVRARLKELASQYFRYRYLMLHGLLKSEELVVNRKRFKVLNVVGRLLSRNSLATSFFLHQRSSAYTLPESAPRTMREGSKGYLRQRNRVYQ